jgi:hypothetical protein
MLHTQHIVVQLLEGGKTPQIYSGINSTNADLSVAGSGWIIVPMKVQARPGKTDPAFLHRS